MARNLMNGQDFGYSCGWLCFRLLLGTGSPSPHEGACLVWGTLPTDFVLLLDPHIRFQWPLIQQSEFHATGLFCEQRLRRPLVNRNERIFSWFYRSHVRLLYLSQSSMLLPKV